MPGTDDHARRYALELLAQAREELSRADMKASILLGAVGVALGAVAGGLVAKGWSPFRLPPAAAFAWWAGAVAVAGGVAALLAAVYPRRRRVTRSPSGPGPHVGYFADVAGYRSAAEVAAAIRRSAGCDLELMADQVLQVSRIVDLKYRLLGWGMWLLAGGVVCNVAALLINAS